MNHVLDNVLVARFINTAWWFKKEKNLFNFVLYNRVCHVLVVRFINTAWGFKKEKNLFHFVLYNRAQRVPGAGARLRWWLA